MDACFRSGRRLCLQWPAALVAALAGKATVHRAPENCGPTANGLKNARSESIRDAARDVLLDANLGMAVANSLAKKVAVQHPDWNIDGIGGKVNRDGIHMCGSLVMKEKNRLVGSVDKGNRYRRKEGKWQEVDLFVLRSHNIKTDNKKPPDRSHLTPNSNTTQKHKQHTHKNRYIRDVITQKAVLARCCSRPRDHALTSFSKQLEESWWWLW